MAPGRVGMGGGEDQKLKAESRKLKSDGRKRKARWEYWSAAMRGPMGLETKAGTDLTALRSMRDALRDVFRRPLDAAVAFRAVRRGTGTLSGNEPNAPGSPTRQ